MPNQETGKEKKKKGGKIVLAICIILIVALCIIIYLLLHQDDETQRDVVVNEENVEEIISKMGDRVPTGNYQVTMNSTWYFENADASSDNAYVENAEANEYPVYFDITRSDTEELIFESPIIPVGKHLDNITLDKKLPAGTYDCILTYHLLDDEEETISTVRVSLGIVIQN